LYNASEYGIVQEFEYKMTIKKLPKAVKFATRGLPLAGAAITVILPLQPVGQQFMVLIVLLWVQVYFVLEIFLAGK
jgi:hypothetical protein